MRRFAKMILTCTAPFAAHAEERAEEWTPLSGEQIQAVLVVSVLDYPSAWQDFRDTGRTLYNAGRDSWGNWQVQDDRYCSQWPPNALWTCFDVEQRGNEVKFIGAHNDVTIGVIRP